MHLVWPARDYLPSYVAALNRGWTPDNVRGDFARLEELARIDADADGFLAALVDREARGVPLTFPDGRTFPRLPGYRRWMWDGDFVGTIGFRWQPGTEALPPYVLGHIGYAVVPWKRGHGHATDALRLLLPEVKAEGLRYVELTLEPQNLSSRHVIEANGGVFVEEFILGIDSQDMNTIAGDILTFAEETGLDALNPTILTPLPGTRDYKSLDADGRILFKNYPQDWEKYTLAFPVTSMPNISGAGLMRKYVEVLQYFRPERVAARYWKTCEAVSPDAAWHAFLWNRVWTNYCLKNGAFRKSPLFERYPEWIPRAVPERPAVFA